MNPRQFNDMIKTTLALIPADSKKLDWLVKQVLNLSQARTSFKQKKAAVLIFSKYIVKFSPPKPAFQPQPKKKNKAID